MPTDHKKHFLHESIANAIRACRAFFLGPANCKHSVGCIDFVTDQFLTQPWFTALKNSIKRVLSCNPFTKN